MQTLTTDWWTYQCSCGCSLVVRLNILSGFLWLALDDELELLTILIRQVLEGVPALLVVFVSTLPNHPWEMLWLSWQQSRMISMIYHNHWPVCILLWSLNTHNLFCSGDGLYGAPCCNSLLKYLSLDSCLTSALQINIYRSFALSFCTRWDK